MGAAAKPVVGDPNTAAAVVAKGTRKSPGRVLDWSLAFCTKLSRSPGSTLDGFMCHVTIRAAT